MHLVNVHIQIKLDFCNICKSIIYRNIILKNNYNRYYHGQQQNVSDYISVAMTNRNASVLNDLHLSRTRTIT